MSPGGQTQRGLPGARGRAPGGRGRSAPSLEDQPGEEWRTDLRKKMSLDVNEMSPSNHFSSISDHIFSFKDVDDFRCLFPDQYSKMLQMDNLDKKHNILIFYTLMKCLYKRFLLI